MKGQTHGGKGDTPRKVDPKKYASEWDRIFGTKKEDEEDEEESD